MIKVVIVDDESYIRERLRLIVKEHFHNELQIVGEASSVKTALELIKKEAPQLLLLDIELTDGSSFDILNELNTSHLDVIFVTAFDSHAIKAIKLGALDYILKPIDELELVKAIKKSMGKSTVQNDLNRLIEVSSGYFYKDSPIKRIAFNTIDSLHIIDEDDIVFCKSDGSYTEIYIKEKNKLTVSKSLKSVLELLSDNKFLRCHQSYVVNKNEVVKYHNQGFLVTKNDERIPVATRRKDYIISHLL